MAAGGHSSVLNKIETRTSNIGNKTDENPGRK